jgi:hypothetical protein
MKNIKQIFSKISGAKVDKVRLQFRVAHIKEVRVLCRPPGIIGLVKSSCLLWVGSVARMRKIWNDC